MYCKNCGYPMDPNAAVCVRCGCARGTGNTYCPNCGAPTLPGAAACTNCGCGLYYAVHPNAKSKLATGLLGLFLGFLGIHNFYLGHTGKAVAQLLLSTVGFFLTCGISTLAVVIWSWIEGIMILSGGINTDAQGIPLKD